MKPRTYTQAKQLGYFIDSIYYGSEKIRVTLKQRYGKGIASFWLTYSGAKRLGINVY